MKRAWLGGPSGAGLGSSGVGIRSETSGNVGPLRRRRARQEWRRRELQILQIQGRRCGVGVPGIQGHPVWARATDLGAGIALQNQVWGLMLQA